MRPEDVDTDGEDHAADEARYFVMSRPIPGAKQTTSTVKPWTLGWLKQQNRKSGGLLDRSVKVA